MKFENFEKLVEDVQKHLQTTIDEQALFEEIEYEMDINGVKEIWHEENNGKELKHFHISRVWKEESENYAYKYEV